MPAMARKSESANWASGIVMHVRSTMPTEFEKRMRELRLTKETCSASDELRRWCTDNRNRCYVPEWLLKTWGISVDTDPS